MTNATFQPTDTVQPTVSVEEPTSASSSGSLLLKMLPYIVMIAAAVFGVAYTDLAPQSARSTWRLLAVLYALIAVAHVFWYDGEEKMKRAGIQAIHWGAVIWAMFIMNGRMVERLVSDDVAGIVLLQLLALATLLDGLYVDWRLSIVGVVLMLGAGVLAFLDQAALTIAIVGIAAVVAVFFLRKLTH
ncbi:MAG: hypothetical protein U1E45_22525 [Geminicoccaceae bacterium]